MALFFLVYLSSSTKLFNDEELNELLLTSRRRNEMVGITGTLLYSEGNITQVLEGEDVDIENTYERIQRDPRHHGLIRVLSGPLEQRNFTDWVMGYKSLKAEDYSRIEGYLNLREKNMEDRFKSKNHPSVEFLKVIYELSSK